MSSDDRQKALSNALGQIEKQFGKGSVMSLGDGQAAVKLDAIPTGSIGLDAALGIGGVARGRFIEIFGPEASGKTTIGLQIIAECQKLGGQAAFIDAEHALDPTYAQALGVDLDKLLVSQPDSGEQALEIAEILTRSGGLDLFVIDSVAALVPRAEIEGEMGDAFVGVQARLMSQALRKLSGVTSRSGTCAVFTNQLRHKIGVMFGSPETTPGGLALKFYTTMRIDVRRIAAIKKGDEVIGNRTRVRVVKNKVAPPFRTTEFDIIYGKGVSRLGELVDIGVEHEIFSKSGSWYAFGDKRIGQGRDAAITFLEENEEDRLAAERTLYEKLGIPQPRKAAPAASDEADAARAAKKK
ncbi:MAG TPA: recombinase RecA [candidate division WOR-3 bacterium]|uniref:Protein RecA n=1 Tax=candidate division WOR-3 bacterium TaxID=2052148 RepID=A0A7V0T7N7_UNCW3|nr:recombinase RecA [candidate division WOR-3 bacterium]